MHGDPGAWPPTGEGLTTVPKATTRLPASRQRTQPLGEIVSGRYPELRATPAPDCDVCAALAKQWEETSDRDVLIEINNHPHDEPKLSRVKQWKAEGASVG